ncbi:TetR/AcrR family transcriptional regulator [Vibrio marisflavi]|uniref:HTH-type transcriptional regulator n=1 Tax=Vibrio marisflavi CECT 7928 TaxID=634439 RepID=A0ABN8EAM6_9VIBR|nr:TetR/AcrR family transcriptional regulator [Vibrio marisflavi]CAH0542050.1 putative HTH-type transcriptional regulator [Vibrio marisflavi CECT 7928]
MSIKEPIDKRQQILAAAEKLVAEFGVQGFSMHKLAKKAGVAAGTIYRYFSDKDHLLNEVRLSVLTRVAEATLSGLNDEMPLKVRFRTIWLNIWEFASSNIETISNRMQYESLPSTCQFNAREQHWHVFAEVHKLFNQGKEQGVFKPLDNEILAVISFEASVELARKHSLGFCELDEEVLEATLDACWDAIITH